MFCYKTKPDWEFLVGGECVADDDVASLALICSLINRTEMRRWLHNTDVRVRRMLKDGWTYDRMYMYGLVREHIEIVYGLTPEESQIAMLPFRGDDSVFWNKAGTQPIADVARKIYEIYINERYLRLEEKLSYDEGLFGIETIPSLEDEPEMDYDEDEESYDDDEDSDDDTTGEQLLSVMRKKGIIIKVYKDETQE